MKALIKIMRGSKVIITSLILLVLVTIFSWGYQLSQHYAKGDSAWFDDVVVSKIADDEYEN